MNMGSYPQSHPFAGYFYPGAWYSAPAPPVSAAWVGIFKIAYPFPPPLLPQHSNIPGLCQLPKPATNSFSGVGSAYQTHHGNLAGYEDVAAVSAHDYTKPYNAAPAALGKPDSDLSTFKQPYDSKPAGANAFNNYGLLQVRGGHPCLHCMRGRAVLWLCGKGEGRDCIEVYVGRGREGILLWLCGEGEGRDCVEVYVGEGPVLWYVRRGREEIVLKCMWEGGGDCAVVMWGGGGKGLC